ncbi:uncharacterized protein LOC144665195 isoform X2 [Oculina patagonica]
MKYIVFHLIFLSCLVDMSALPTKSKRTRTVMENDAQSTGAQKGKTVIEPVGDDGFHCQHISFSSNFSSGSPVRVFISINHGNESSEVHDPAFIWAADVTTSGFKACLVKSGRGSGQNTTIDWFAFQGSQSGVYHGSESFGLFTTGIQCRQVTFPQAFSVVPKLHVTVQHGIPNQKQDAMIFWTESVSTSQFEVCLLESRTFDGPHDNIAVNWMAYEHFASLSEAKESSEIVFADNEIPTAENNYALCKNITFATPFFTAPVAIVTVRNGGSNNANAVCRRKCPLSSWLEEVTTSYFRVCIRDNAGYNRQRSNVIVDYLVIGDLDPCTNVTCKYHSHCEALAPHQFTCVCEDSCPSYEEQVCASNGRTFQNLCLLQQEICRTRGNYTKYHPGSCRGFPLQKGRHEFQNIPSWAEDQCEVIQFEPYIFYPHKKIYIQLTVNHHNYSDATFVHEATTPWVESVNSTQFTACVTRAGRNDYPSDSFATIDWIAYQGAPSGGVVGEEMFSRWWTGTSCRTVILPNGKYSRSPKIFATSEHHRSGLKHDAASVWLEDVSASSFKICLRELQNFAGVHDDISVNWLAFESLHRPLFSEQNDISFQNNVLPSKINNFAFCKDVNFIRNYTKAPTVVLTAKHVSSGGNAPASCSGIVSWIEFITNSQFRICAKELFVQRFDPLTVSYAVLSDVCQDSWAYFKGYCYRKVSSCDSWSNSQATCATLGANLPSIHSQEENVYVQSLHGGEHSWLGLSDINTEGTFVWSDGTPLDFHYWTKPQPNNFQNEDCVHTLGLLHNHKYRWNDVNCTDCHGFTCKKDYDECKYFSYDCPVNSSCVNSDGSYSCQCPVGYRLDGNNCRDIDECHLGSFSCHSQAQCVNIPGTYNCICLPGYAGDGKTSCYGPSVTATASCSNTLVQATSTGGIIDSSINSYHYSNNMNCQWIISSNTMMELAFFSFKTSTSDYVTVYDGGSTSSPLIGRYNRYSLPAPIISSSNKLYMTFVSDGSGYNSGFRARYRAVTGGTLRINGSTPSIGRVEIFYDGQWGTICDDAWDINDANVVCKQLGYQKALQAYRSATHGQGTGPIWMDDVACSGGESHLHDCRHRGWGNSDCTHSQDASVQCYYGSSTLRLMDGGANAGRVEVYYNGQWGTVCDDAWDINDANVVCRQLGFSSASSFPWYAAYGQGSEPTWMDDVSCQGGESSLFSCAHRGWGDENCSHSEDASVVCNT